MKYLYELPKESKLYLKVSMIRTGLLFFVMFAFLKFTNIWIGFEDKLILLGGYAIIYHWIIFFVKRYKEKKAHNKGS